MKTPELNSKFNGISPRIYKQPLCNEDNGIVHWKMGEIHMHMHLLVFQAEAPVGLLPGGWKQARACLGRKCRFMLLHRLPSSPDISANRRVPRGGVLNVSVEDDSGRGSCC